MDLIRPAALLALALAACVPDHGPTMRPGEDCTVCHTATFNPAATLPSGEPPRHAKAWNIAGTVYADPDAPDYAGLQGAHVQIVDAHGFSFAMRTNAAGNFYTAEKVTFPLRRACVERGGVVSCMIEPAPSGSCNSCHSWPQAGNGVPRVTAP